MADDIVIDKQLFHERLNGFVTKWKADKRSGDQLFNGAGAIATVVGKASDPGSYMKPAAFQVRADPRHSAGSTDTWLIRLLAMASRLRVPGHPLHHHARPVPDCHDAEKGYVPAGPWRACRFPSTIAVANPTEIGRASCRERVF